MKKKAFIKIIPTLLLHLAVMAFAITGCSDSGAEHGNEAPLDSEAANTAEQGNTPENDNTLTIAAAYTARELNRLASKYMSENPGVSIEIIDYTDHEKRDGHWGLAQQEIATQLMAGSGAVLMDGFLVDYLAPQSAAYFADWFPIMYADPDFKEEDWFMNVFHATAANGRLYAFSTAFYYPLVAANSAVPGLLEAMEGRGGISVMELLELHREIPTDTTYFFEYYFSTQWVLELYLDTFIDIETGRVDFSDEFVDFISHAKEITDTGKDPEYFWPLTPSQETALSDRYFYHLSNSVAMDYQYLLELEKEPLFTSFTPITNSNGELLVYPIEAYVLSAYASPAQQSLAWDFVKFMAEPDNQPQYISMQPTKRELLRIAIEHDLPKTLADAYKRQLTYSVDEAVEDALRQMTAFGEMPMQNIRSLPNVFFGWGSRSGILREALELFEDGLVSAEQTALNLQNQVELVMMEIGGRR